jgi:hypothetical protein
MILGSIPSFEIIRGKNIQNIQWHQVVHPIMCSILGTFDNTFLYSRKSECGNQNVFIDKSVIDTHTSAIILSPNLVLCCGKDGQLRLFRNRYEVK